MKLRIAWIGKTKEPAITALTAEYMKRLGRFAETESMEFASEDALLKAVEKLSGRTRPVLVILDQRGRQFTSEEFSEFLSDQQDRGSQQLIFAVGPADGFTAAARQAADLTLAFGKMTLAHELAHLFLGHLGADRGRNVPDRRNRDRR